MCGGTWGVGRGAGGAEDARPRLGTAGVLLMAARAAIVNRQELQWCLLENSMKLKICKGNIRWRRRRVVVGNDK